MDTVNVRRAQWAFAKLARAAQHIRSLESAIGLWAVAANYRPDAAISTDRLSWEVHARLDQTPALTEWSLLAGDAIHNLRASLDVLVWAYADADGLSSRQQRDLGFPLERTAEGWTDVASRRLRSVPGDVVDRVRLVQPFQRPSDEVESDGLLLLHELDIRDKHRLAVRAQPTLASMTVNHEIEFSDAEAAARNTPPQITVHDDAALVDGALVLSGTATDPIAKVKGQTNLSFRMSLETPRGDQPLLDSLRALHLQVAATVTFIDTGQVLPQPMTMPAATTSKGDKP